MWQLGLNAVGVLDAELPGAGRATLYARFGNSIAAGVAILLLGIVGWARIRADGEHWLSSQTKRYPRRRPACVLSR